MPAVSDVRDSGDLDSPAQNEETVDAGTRSLLRAVGMPSEHGGWGLTAEPILLGMLVAPSVAGVFVGMAGVLAFVMRTPLKFVLVDGRRHRMLERTRVARRLAAAEFVVIVLLAVGALFATSAPFWAPVLVASPLIAVELWFDMRSRSRRLIPQLAGSVGISSLAAAVALAGGARAGVAVGAWIVLSARALTSIPFVRRQVMTLHGRTGPTWPLVVWDVVAVVVGLAATVLDGSVLAGSIAVVVVVIVQRLSAARPVSRAAVVGMRQMVLGFVLVLVTWSGVLSTGGAS